MGGGLKVSLLIVASCVACGTTVAASPPVTQTLVRVNGQDISETMLKVYALSKTGEPLARLSPAVRQSLLAALVNTALLAQEGGHLKFTAALEAGRKLARMRYLSSVDIAHLMLSDRFSPQQIRAEYKRLAAAHALEQYQLRQILLPDMAAGEHVRTLLAQGMPFARAVSLYSHDPVSRPKGGDLGWLSRPVAVPYVANAAEMGNVLRIASELRTGGISEPFVNRSGVHIVELLAARLMPLAAVKKRIKGILLRQALVAHTARLRSAARITELTHPKEASGARVSP